MLFYGNIVHSVNIQNLEYIIKGALIIKDGKIICLEKNVTEKDLENLIRKHQIIEVKRLKECQLIFPGFIDCHTHAPQCENIGIGLDKPLLEWLETYTFKEEAKYKDIAYAKEKYTKFVDKCISDGSTTVSYFASIHKEATIALSDICNDKGQRAFIGKVNMDINSPEYYIETVEQSLKETEELINEFEKYDKITYCITPRFAISCSSPLMNGLAKISEKFMLPIQSHLNENKDEISFVKKLYPESQDYASVYKYHNLMNNRSYYAHCVHNTNNEMEIFNDYDVGIVHCPDSNFQLLSGVMDSRKCIDMELKISLGTDVSGGTSTSMLDSMRKAILASKECKIRSNNEDYKILQLEEVVYMSTLGGSKVLNLNHLTGNFEIGKSFDALIVDLELLDAHNSPDMSSMDKLKYNIQRFVMLGDGSNIRQVWVDGKCIKDKGSMSVLS